MRAIHPGTCCPDVPQHRAFVAVSCKLQIVGQGLKQILIDTFFNYMTYRQPCMSFNLHRCRLLIMPVSRGQ